MVGLKSNVFPDRPDRRMNGCPTNWVNLTKRVSLSPATNPARAPADRQNKNEGPVIAIRLAIDSYEDKNERTAQAGRDVHARALRGTGDRSPAPRRAMQTANGRAHGSQRRSEQGSRPPPRAPHPAERAISPRMASIGRARRTGNQKTSYPKTGTNCGSALALGQPAPANAVDAGPLQATQRGPPQRHG